jgi:hypothetical protein
MHSYHREKGMTMWSLLFVLAVIAFVTFMIFKLLPPYLEDFKVKSALDSLAKQQDIGTMTKADIVNTMQKRFDIDNVSYVKPAQHMTIETRGRNRTIRITYEAVVPIFSNISVLLEFDHTREVRAGE